MRCGDILQCSKSKDRRKNTKQEQSKYGPLRGTGVIKDEHPLLTVCFLLLRTYKKMTSIEAVDIFV